MRFYEAEDWFDRQLSRIRWRRVGLALLVAWAMSWVTYWLGWR